MAARISFAMTLALLVGLLGWSPARAEPPTRLTLFLTEGAGDYTTCSRCFAAVAADHGWPADIVRYRWSHGLHQRWADQTVTADARRHAATLAGIIRAHIRDGGGPVALVGYSAGCAVTVFTAELLPAGSVERIVLLAPSMSADYDLSQAMKATRRGVDVFVSHRDCIALGIGVGLVGGADEIHGRVAAGRVGYTNTEGACLASGQSIRHHHWNRSLMQLGYGTGHYGSYAPDHLQAVVYPLLFGE